MRAVVSSVLPESLTLDESLDGILEVDVVLCQVFVAPMVLIVFCSVCLGLYRSGSRTSDAAIFELGIRVLCKDTLAGSGQ